MQKMRESFGISTTEECRLWYFNNDSYIVLNDLEKTLLDATTAHDLHLVGSTGDKAIINEKVVICYILQYLIYCFIQPLILEIRNPDGSWPWRIELHLQIINTNDILFVVSFGVFETAG